MKCPRGEIGRHKGLKRRRFFDDLTVWTSIKSYKIKYNLNNQPKLIC